MFTGVFAYLLVNIGTSADIQNVVVNIEFSNLDRSREGGVLCFQWRGVIVETIGSVNS